MIALRKQNLSIYDIGQSLEQAGDKLSPAAISLMLKQEGFARLPRRRDDERPAATRPDVAAKADVRALDLSERPFRTKAGGLFLFLPYLTKIPLDQMLNAPSPQRHWARQDACGQPPNPDVCPAVNRPEYHCPRKS